MWYAMLSLILPFYIKEQDHKLIALLAQYVVHSASFFVHLFVCIYDIISSNARSIVISSQSRHFQLLTLFHTSMAFASTKYITHCELDWYTTSLQDDHEMYWKFCSMMIRAYVSCSQPKTPQSAPFLSLQATSAMIQPTSLSRPFVTAK